MPNYPLISRLDDYCGDMVYRPSEVPLPAKVSPLPFIDLGSSAAYDWPL